MPEVLCGRRFLLIEETSTSMWLNKQPHAGAIAGYLRESVSSTAIWSDCPCGGPLRGRFRRREAAECYRQHCEARPEYFRSNTMLSCVNYMQSGWVRDTD